MVSKSFRYILVKICHCIDAKCWQIKTYTIFSHPDSHIERFRYSAWYYMYHPVYICCVASRKGGFSRPAPPGWAGYDKKMKMPTCLCSTGMKFYRRSFFLVMFACLAHPTNTLSGKQGIDRSLFLIVHRVSVILTKMGDFTLENLEK